MSQPTAHLPFRLLLECGDKPFALDLVDAVLITCFCTRESRGAGVIVRKEYSDEKTIGLAFQKMEGESGLKIGNCEIKLVGENELLERVRRIIHRMGMKVGATIERARPHFKVIYYPRTGRMRVEKEPASAEPVAEGPLRILIVDDSSTIRKPLTTMFQQDPSLKVATVPLPSQVEAMIQSFKPHVITLDIHMPEMDGITLLKKIAPKYHIPTVMITSVSREEGSLVLEALESGAIDYIQKPTIQELKQLAPIIIEKIKIAAKARKKRAPSGALSRVKIAGTHRGTLVAIGSSTGGTEALRELLIRLPEDIPPIVISQHIPPVFSDALARRLNDLCPFEVKEAADGDAIERGRVLIAPGGRQLRVKKVNGRLVAAVTDDGPVNRHCPSVDALFNSVAEVVGANAIGIILTGMGADGAKGMLQMKKRGAHTIAQDENTCVVFGMPKEAIKLGAVEEVVPLTEIPERLAFRLMRQKVA